jgi:hypothetical protein
MHIAEKAVPESSSSGTVIATENMERHKLPGVDQIPAKLIQEAGNAVRSELRNLLMLLGGRKNRDRNLRNVTDSKRNATVTNCTHHFIEYTSVNLTSIRT